MFMFLMIIIFCFSGVFCLLFAYAALNYIQSHISREDMKNLFVFAVAGAAGIVFMAVVGLTYAGQLVLIMIYLLLNIKLPKLIYINCGHEGLVN